MDTKFSEWLSKKMKERNWSQSDLARASGLTRQAISYYLSEKSKQPDEFALQEIAHAFKLPPEEVYRVAGLLPPNPQKDETLQRIDYLYSILRKNESKQQALEYIEFLKTQEERVENVESPRKKSK